MVKRGAGGTGMTSGEKLLGGMALAVYVFVLPLTAEWLFNGAEKVFGVSLDRGARDLAYYAVLFGLVLIAFWGFFGRNTRAFFDRTWQVLGAAGVGEGAQDAVIAVAVVALMLVATLILLSEKELASRWGVRILDVGGLVEKTPEQERAEARVAEVAEHARLTPRETEILQLIAQGKNGPAIMGELFIAEGTFKAHTSHIYEKCGVANRRELRALLGVG